MRKRLCVFFPMLIALSIVCTFSASALFVDTVEPFSELQPRLGSSSQTIYLGGKGYNCEFSLGASSSIGAYSNFNTNARVARLHNDVYVVFETLHDGGQPNHDGREYYNAMTGSSISGYVRCPVGMQEVVSYRSINATGIIYGNKDYNFSAAA